MSRNTAKKIEDIKFDEHLIDKKQMVVVYFDYQYPIGEEDISQITQTISNIINTDTRFINRCIFLPKGFDMYNLNEEDFISIWKSKVDAKEVDEIINEDKDPNQLELFNDKEIIE
tara:strand:+ start:18 stop:362 length:345 start_codon:yes stop_codon:yes gene_type:complete